MNLYLISQDVNTSYDTFDSAVVAAETKENAQKIKPAEWASVTCEWATTERVKVQLIGQAVEGTEAGVILASFNAG